MIAGADYVEINHELDLLTITIHEKGCTATARVAPSHTLRLQKAISDHIKSAEAYRAPTLIENT